MRARGSDTAPVRALVVDDDALMVALLRAFLTSRGYAVTECRDGDSALAQVRAGGINLVVTDRNMPGMDGLALCRGIRALASESYVYCIMLTASGDEASLVAAMEAGVDDFVAKPLRLAELGARLHAGERVLMLEAGLAARNRDLARANAQLHRELELARVLQLGQLPPPGAAGPVRFDWVFEASGFVGGDIFDYYALDARHVCFCLADVSGHGVPAAMMAFHAQHQLRAATQQTAPPLLRDGSGIRAAAVAVATEYNGRFLQMKETSLYLTLLYGIVDTHAGRLALVQAGHPAPLYAAAAGEAYAPLGEGGVPIGILAQPGYEAREVDFRRGARLVVYSDGVTDCRDPEDEPFGEQRLQQVLDHERGASLAAAGVSLHGALRAWRGPRAFEDDVTLLGVEAG